MNTEKIPDDRSVIVVSDTHFGSDFGSETVKRFCNFLEKIRSGDTPVIPSIENGLAGSNYFDSGPKNLLPPAKIILLGDILEFWNPRMRDRINSFMDALVVFLELRNLPSDVIYVTGNHDEDVADLVRTSESRQGDIKNSENQIYSVFTGEHDEAESLKIAWNGEYILEVSPRHYPASTTKGEIRGLNSGGVHYAFIHGQQFDKQQITYTISKAIGQRFDVIDSIQDLANCFFTKRVGQSWILTALIGILLALTVLPFFTTLFIPDSDVGIVKAWVGMIIGLGFALLFLKGIHLFGIENSTLPSSPLLLKISAGLFTLEVLTVLADFYLSSSIVFNLFYILGLIITVYCLCTIVIPLCVTKMMKQIYSVVFSAKDYNVTEIYEYALKSSSYTYNAEVLIFGHTHVPGSYPESPDLVAIKGRNPGGKPSLLINTGRWIVENDYVEDSFVYIDKTGVSRMLWMDETQEIRCLQFFPSKSLTSL